MVMNNEKEKEKTKKARLEEQLMRDTYKRYEWKNKPRVLILQKSTSKNIKKREKIKQNLEQRGKISKRLGITSVKDLRIKFKDLIEKNFGLGVEFNKAMAQNVCCVHGGFSTGQWETIYKDMLTPNSKNSICVSHSSYCFPNWDNDGGRTFYLKNK